MDVLYGIVWIVFWTAIVAVAAIFFVLICRLFGTRKSAQPQRGPIWGTSVPQRYPNKEIWG